MFSTKETQTGNTIMLVKQPTESLYIKRLTLVFPKFPAVTANTLQSTTCNRDAQADFAWDLAK
jgi:hypothetical protein